jgi:hypothetical protein
MSHDRLRDRLSEGSADEPDRLTDEGRPSGDGTGREPAAGSAVPDGDAGSSSEGGQVSETDSLHGAGTPIEPSDSVAGGPAGESGTAQEGAQGPEAPTFAENRGHHPDKDDVETTG